MQQRTRFRRTGAALAMFALLVQCLVLAFHHPAQAASYVPFQDPGAFCGAVPFDGGGPAAPDETGSKAPVQRGVVCPICLSLHAAGTGVLPVLVALVVPGAVREPSPLAVRSDAPAPFGRSTANPRAPPVIL